MNFCLYHINLNIIVIFSACCGSSFSIMFSYLSELLILLMLRVYTNISSSSLCSLLDNSFMWNFFFFFQLFLFDSLWNPAAFSVPLSKVQKLDFINVMIWTVSVVKIFSSDHSLGGIQKWWNVDPCNLGKCVV